MVHEIHRLHSDRSLHSPSQVKVKKAASTTDNKIKGTKDKAIPSSALLVFKKAALVSRKIVLQPEVQKTFKNAIKSTTLSTISFACKIISFTKKGLIKNLSNDFKTTIGLFKVVISLPEIATKIANSISYAVKRRTYKQELAAVQKEIEKLSKKQLQFLAKVEHKILTEDTKEYYTNLSNTVSSLNQKKEHLVKQIKEANSKIYGFVELPKDLLEVAASSISFAMRVGSHLKTIPEAVLSGLSTATTVLGTVAGGISIALGVVDIGKSIYNVCTSYKKLVETNKKIQTVELAFTSEAHEGKKALYAIELSDLQKERQTYKNSVVLSVIAIGSSALVVTGGALAIAAAFTAGTTALVLVAIGFGVGLIATGIKIGTIIQKKRQEAQLKGYTIDEAHHKLKKELQLGNLRAQDIIDAYAKIDKKVDDNTIKDSTLNPSLFLRNLYPHLLQEKKNSKK